MDEQMIAATRSEVQIFSVDSDESLALWPFEASYSQAKLVQWTDGVEQMVSFQH